MVRELLRFTIGLCVWAGLAVSAPWTLKAADLYFGSGAKVGEITSNSAIVWTRLTTIPKQNEEGLIPGTAGEVRVRYSDRKALKSLTTTDWAPVDEDNDFTVQIRLSGLKPNSRYYYTLEGRATPDGDVVSTSTAEKWSFITAPAPDARAPVRFQVTTGQDLRADRTYKYMAQQDPAFLVATGDNVYYDSKSALPGNNRARTIQQAFQAYQRMYGMPWMKKYYEHVGGYFEKDDHDYRFNDSDPYQTVKGGDGGRVQAGREDSDWLSHEEGIHVFKKVWPMSDPTYRTFRWGKGVQIWLLEGRDFRSANRMPDGPDKTIWGAEQKGWLMNTLAASDADWRIVISPTPIIGPDRPTKTDNHANKNGFWTEGQAFLDWIKDEGLRNVVLICGDRHWQYHSVDQRNGRNIPEFSCGPTCDAHTQKVVPPEVSPDFTGVEQPYAASKGGFLTVSYSEDRTLAFEFYGETGLPFYAVTFEPEE